MKVVTVLSFLLGIYRVRANHATPCNTEGSDQLAHIDDPPTCTLSKCEGDCDYDNDCRDGLICYHRHGGENEPQPPGCIGTPYDSFYDYCVEIFPCNTEGSDQLVFIDDPPRCTLSKCEGDCDDDSDCKDGLKCHQLQGNENEPLPPGCIGPHASHIFYDYCVETAVETTPDPTPSPISTQTASSTGNPTPSPTANPTSSPTANPTGNPTSDPTANPTGNPTSNPTTNPTSNPSASPTLSSYPTDQGIIDINEHSIDNITCVGEITEDSFEPSVTCTASKFPGTKAAMEMKQGNCTGTQLVKKEDTDNDTITCRSGSVDKFINDTNQAFEFCLVVQTFIGTALITEGKTEGNVILARDLSGEFRLELSMEAYTTDVTSLDTVTGNDITLTAYQCKNDYSEILNPTEKPQGSTLTVCIVTDQASSVSLTDVSMNISPSTTNSFAVTSIIASDMEINSALTKFNSHSDGNKVQVKTILVSRYFADPSNTIVVSGTANYKYSSERERMLRVLQSIEDEDTPPFVLKIDLKANEAGIFQLSSSAAHNLSNVYNMSFLMTCVVAFFI